MNRIPFFTLFIFSIHSFAQILTESRITSWEPGFSDNPPLVNQALINVVTGYGVANDSSADASTKIQDAINSLDEGGVIYLPKGIYRLDNQIKLTHDGIILRGDGAGHTKLYSSYSGSSVFIGTYQRGTWQSLISGFEKNSSKITVSNGSTFNVGEFAEIQQDNDPSLMYTKPEWKQPWAENSVGQLFEIKEINGNELTLKKPLHYEVRSDLKPQIREQNFRRNCGIENLYLEKTNATSHSIELKNAAYNWVKGVESNKTRRSHINVNTGIGNEFKGNLFHHSYFYGGGGSGYGIELNFHSTDNLVENNIFHHLRHSMMVHVGAVGNVFAYNYSFDTVQGENGDEGLLNQVWTPPDISLHGHWAQYNLFEGNVVEEIGIGDHWGPMGPGNTFLRNVVRKTNIYISDHNLDQNLIGNTALAFDDDGTSTGTILHMNQIAGTVQKESTLLDTIVPSSYYLKGEFNFWRGGLDFPVQPLSPSDSALIPAVMRWVNATPMSLNTTTISTTSIQRISSIHHPNISISLLGNEVTISGLLKPTTVNWTDPKGKTIELGKCSKATCTFTSNTQHHLGVIWLK